jgi:hypothetical protein
LSKTTWRLRAFAYDVAAHAQSRETAIARPILSGAQQQRADAATTGTVADDQTREFGERHFLDMQSRHDVGPAEHGRSGIDCNEHFSGAGVAHLHQSLTHRFGVTRVAELGRQVGKSGRFVALPGPDRYRQRRIDHRCHALYQQQPLPPVCVCAALAATPDVNPCRLA